MAQEVLARHCEVCFVPFERATPSSLDEGTAVLLCSGCNVTVHKCCYDFQPALTVLTETVSHFLCELCTAELPQPAKCLVCHGTEGAMKLLQNKEKKNEKESAKEKEAKHEKGPPRQQSKQGSQEFIHVYCALVHNEIDILSYYPSLTFRKAPHY